MLPTKCAFCLRVKKWFSMFINLTDSNLNCLLKQKSTMINTKIIAKHVLNLWIPYLEEKKWKKRVLLIMKRLLASCTLQTKLVANQTLWTELVNIVFCRYLIYLCLRHQQLIDLPATDTILCTTTPVDKILCTLSIQGQV